MHPMDAGIHKDAVGKSQVMRQHDRNICEADVRCHSVEDSKVANFGKDSLCEVLKVRYPLFLDSSMVEHSAVNRVVVGSSPTRGVYFYPIP